METTDVNFSSEEEQREQYDKIIAEYEVHYGDPNSLEYRERFFYDKMFSGIDLNGKKVLEAMCGSGLTTGYLLSKNADVTGLDISPNAVDIFKQKWKDSEAVCGSIFDSGFEDETFDCIVVCGGLHHLHPQLKDAVVELHRILKTGGHFCFMEPHTGSVFDFFRKIWYKFDSYFADNEASIDVEKLKKDFADKFDFKMTVYSGNIAFFLVCNSLIFRIPVGAKPYYSKPLMSIEEKLTKLQTKTTSSFVLGQWVKK